MNTQESHIAKDTLHLMERTAFWLLLIMGISSLTGLIYVTYTHLDYQEKLSSNAKTRLQNLTSKSVEHIDSILSNAVQVVDDIADDLSNKRLKKNKNSIKRRLKTSVLNNPHFYGVAIAFEPFVFRKNIQLYSPYYYRPEGKDLSFRQVENVYDYTTREWYTKGIKYKHGWVEPYFGEAGETLMTTYVRVFYVTDPATQERRPGGVVVVDISMDEIKKIIESLDLGPSGFGALTSDYGYYLYHPNSEYVKYKKTMLDVAQRYNDDDRILIWQRTSKGIEDKGIIEHISTTTGLSSWLAYEKITTANWLLQNTFIKSDVQMDYQVLRRQLIDIVLFAMVFLLSGTLLILQVYKGQKKRLWLGVGAVSILMAGAIGMVWYITLTYIEKDIDKSVKVLDRVTLNNIKIRYNQNSAARHTEAPRYIPTGIFIESIRFFNGDDAIITGYVWQKFHIDLPEKISKEFSIYAAEDLEIREVYRHPENDWEVVRWHFQAKVRQQLSHSRYPIEQEKLGIIIVPKKINNNVILVPDLRSYKLINPTSLPAIDKSLTISGWKVEKSFFEIVDKPYDVNFGATQSVLQENFPLLRFSIIIKRNFIDAFVSNLTSVIVVAVMLFAIQMTMTSDEKLVAQMRTGTGMALSLCSALFFVVVFSHIDIRQRISSEEIFYLEYFYFVIYLTILWVASSSILFSMAKDMKFLQYQDNLVSKLLYWPVLVGALLAVTLFTFY